MGNIFRDQAQLSQHLAILCYIKKLTSSYILLKSLLAAFSHLPLASHNIQSFKGKQIEETKTGEKFKKKCNEHLIPCIFLNHDSKNFARLRLNPQFECFL